MTEKPFFTRISVPDSSKPIKSIKAVFNFIIIGLGLNNYVRRVLDLTDLQDSVEVGGKRYNIDHKSFFLVSKHFQRLRKREYAIVYRLGESKPILFNSPRILRVKKNTKGKKEESHTVTARMVKTARNSRALGQGLTELFTEHFSGRKIFFFLLVGVMVIVAFLVMTGQIDLTQLV